MTKFLRFSFILCVLIITGCSMPPKQPTMTPLEIQTLQTRDYEQEKEVVFASVTSVFQDLGYTISNADFQTGLIYAESASKSNKALKFLIGVSQVERTKATGFVEQLKGRTRVRLNFVLVQKESSAYGRSDQDDTPLLDAKLYEAAFERIDSAIFLRVGTE